MEVILKQDVERLGKTGSVVKVKDGFARNFLIPNGLAVFATKGNLKKLELEIQKKSAQLEKAKLGAMGLSQKLSGLSLTIAVLAKDNDELYGSLNAADIVAALKDEGYEIDKNAFILDEQIKSLGVYEIPVKLHPEVSAKIKVWIVRK